MVLGAPQPQPRTFPAPNSGLQAFGSVGPADGHELVTTMIMRSPFDVAIVWFLAVVNLCKLLCYVLCFAFLKFLLTVMLRQF